jgi:HlyD family secretion protein
MLNQVVEELRKVQAELYDLNERVRAAKDVLARTDIRAPLAGTVVDLQVHTAGGVIAAGAPLLDIVPSDRRLVVEAKVNPRDIDVVRQGLEAQVRFTAFNQRHRAPTQGTLTSVSADLLTDETSGEKYYLARVELVETQAVAIDLDELYPGMQAEVMIVTGARSALDYLIEPLMKSFDRAFRES